MVKSRAQKAFVNTASQMLFEIVTILCGLILPRLILSTFGSAYNGITQSISQFISCFSLLNSGISSVTKAALYKPLAQNDYYGISEVVNATRLFIRKISIIFGISILCFSAVYPFIIIEDFSWFFTFSLVLILSFNAVIGQYVGLSYKVVLEADQKRFIFSISSISVTVVNTIVSVVLINGGFSIHAVKIANTIICFLPAIFYRIYVGKKYHIRKDVPPNNSLISQRWDAFGHQLANFVNNNTDIIITTIFLGVYEVSVYTIYNMIAFNIRRLVNSFSLGINAAFGNMLAKEETDNLKSRFCQFETMLFVLSTIAFIVTAILYVPFVRIYTHGVTDVNYIRRTLSIMFCIAGFFECIRGVYEKVVFAAGNFKNTKKYDYAEAIINITISLILANFLGLVGLLIGTTVAGIYRMITYNRFASKFVVPRNSLIIAYKLLYTAICVVLCCLLSSFLPLGEINNYMNWFIWAVIIFCAVSVLCGSLACLFFSSDMKVLCAMAKGIIKNKH